MTKFSQWYREILLPAGLLSSLIIGAGMFALPFVFARAGFITGLFYLALFTFVFSVIHIMYAKVIEETSGRHRLVGYANIYLKRFGFWTTIVTTALGIVFALTAYISLAGGFINLVLPQISESVAPYIIWILGSLAIIISLRRLAGFEFAVSVSIGLIVLFLFGVGFLRGGDIAIPIFDASAIFLPFGIVLFALSGRAGISAIVDYYERNKFSKEKLHHAIRIGTITPAVIYILFALSIYWLSGGNVSEDALTGILGLPYALLALVGSLGVFALLTSYFFLGIEVRDIFRYDLKFPPSLAIMLVTVLPMAMFLFGISNFIKLIGIAGGIFLAIESIMVIFIYSKVKSWSILSRILVALFAVGAAYEFMQIF